jgi:hypothetical protein
VPNLFLLKTTFGYRKGDVPIEMRPQITIVMPGAQQSVEAYTSAVRIADAVSEAAPVPALPEAIRG